eukprot:PhF_6_TR35014/c0_g1_i3/m.50953/K04354/PPP2R2; serine/threonine-protein phosphatase 2A regulatory subunit B
MYIPKLSFPDNSSSTSNQPPSSPPVAVGVGGVSPRPNAQVLPTHSEQIKNSVTHHNNAGSAGRIQGNNSNTNPNQRKVSLPGAVLPELLHSQCIRKDVVVPFPTVKVMDFTSQESIGDVVTAMKFSPDGKYLVSGDRGGYLHVCSLLSPSAPSEGGFPTSFRAVGAMEAYRRTIDPLNSLTIEERVNRLAWLPQQTQNHLFLTTNDKIVKMWKVVQRKNITVPTTSPVDMLLSGALTHTGNIPIPKVSPQSSCITLKEVRAFSMDHEFSVNSVSVDSEARYVLTSDDLSLRMWATEHLDTSLEVRSIKPFDLEQLSETITGSSFHPVDPNLLWYHTSTGFVNVFDTRSSLNCETPVVQLEGCMYKIPEMQASPFGNVTCAVSGCAWSPDGYMIASRDFVSVKLWDIRNATNGPVRIAPVHNGLLPLLPELHESEAVFDKFDVVFSANGQAVYTGSYKYEFLQIDPKGLVPMASYSVLPPSYRSTRRSPPIQSTQYTEVDFKCKCLTMCSYPRYPSDVGVAVGAGDVISIMSSSTTTN